MSFFVPVFDLGGQVLICYICWTQGSSKQMKQFSCTLVPDRNGGMRLQFTPIESVLESRMRHPGRASGEVPSEVNSDTEPYEMTYSSFLAQ
jgi:hypothetical protein